MYTFQMCTYSPNQLLRNKIFKIKVALGSSQSKLLDILCCSDIFFAMYVIGLRRPEIICFVKRFPFFFNSLRSHFATAYSISLSLFHYLISFRSLRSAVSTGNQMVFLSMQQLYRYSRLSTHVRTYI